jgi:hypothetical protein
MRFLPLVPALVLVAPAACSQAPPSPTLLGHPLDQAVLYEGKIVFSQHAGGEKAERSFKTRLLALSSPRAGGDARQLTAVRVLESDEEDEGPLALIDRVALEGRNIDLEEPETELERAHGRLEIYFPLPIPPSFAPPAADTERSGEAEVVLLNLAGVKGRFRERAQRAEGGEGLEATRELVKGSAEDFEFPGGSAARLASWKEEFTLDARGVVLRHAMAFAVVVTDEDGDEVRLELRSSLASTSLAPPAGAELAKLKSAEEELTSILRALRERKPSEAVEPRVEKLEGLLTGSPFEPLAMAARTHLEGYEQTFEITPGGEILARILGGTAPDFELEDLKGNKVRFHEAIAGKVALLTFWGVG